MDTVTQDIVTQARRGCRAAARLSFKPPELDECLDLPFFERKIFIQGVDDGFAFSHNVNPSPPLPNCLLAW